MSTIAPLSLVLTTFWFRKAWSILWLPLSFAQYKWKMFSITALKIEYHENCIWTVFKKSSDITFQKINGILEVLVFVRVGVQKEFWGRIPGRNWNKSHMRFPPFHTQSSPPTSFSPHSPWEYGLKLVCDVKIMYRNLKSENSQDYAQKPQRNCTLMNSASDYL